MSGSRWLAALGGPAAVLWVVLPCAVAAQQDPNDAIGFGPDTQEASPAREGGTDQDAVGFGSSDAQSTPRDAPSSVLSDQPSPFALSATLRLQGAVRTQTDQPQRLAKLRQVLDAGLEYKQHLGSARIRILAGVHTEADFAYLGNRAAYDTETLDTMGWQVWPAPTYVSFGMLPFELTTGYQIIQLGQAEMVSLLDLVNGRDLREGPLMTEMSNLRLPTLATRASLGVGPLRVEGIIVHEAFFGLLPPVLGEFSPFRSLLLQNSAVGEALQGRVLRNQHLPARDVREVDASQLFARLTLVAPGVDSALLVGSTLERFGMPSLPDAAHLSGAVLDFPLPHPRYTVIASTGTVTSGPVMLRWELTFEHARPIALQRTDTKLTDWSSARRHVLSGLLGITYLASTTTSSALEVTQALVLNNPARSYELHLKPLFPLEATQFAFRFNHSFLRERANFGLVALLIGLAPLNAWAARVEFGYALLDSVEVSVGYLTYHPTSNFGYAYGFTQHDRAFINVRLGLSE